MNAANDHSPTERFCRRASQVLGALGIGFAVTATASEPAGGPAVRDVIRPLSLSEDGARFRMYVTQPPTVDQVPPPPGGEADEFRAEDVSPSDLLIPRRLVQESSPVTPDEPEASDEPEAPDEPVAPEEPATPDEAVKPDEPVVSDEPEASATAETQTAPDRAETPEEPQSVAPPVVDPPPPVVPPPPVAPPPTPRNFGGSRAAFGATLGSGSAAPNMIGDLFGNTIFIAGEPLVTVALAGGDRRFKVSENVSPIPQDRVFVNYNHFHNAVFDVTGRPRSVDRFTLGLEKTFLGGQASIETRIPLVRGLDTTQRDGIPGMQQVEFGNIGLGLKAILLSGRDWLVSGGTTMTFPTGDDFQVLSPFDVSRYYVDNDSVHIAPYLGFLKQPNQCWFAQGFVQADFDLNGNDVYRFGGVFQGTVQDQNLLFIDASIGRWLYRGCDRCRGLSGIAAIGELHYTHTLNDTDVVANVQNPLNRMDIVNGTAALAFRCPKSTLRVGAAAPLSGSDDRLFDAEIIVQFNRFF